MSALTVAARCAEAITLGRDVAARARKLGHEPLIAEAMLAQAVAEHRGDARAAAEDSYYEAAEHALAGRHQDALARAAIGLVALFARDSARRRDAEHWARVATGAVTPLPPEAVVRAELSRSLGMLYYEQGRFEESAEHYRDAIFRFEMAYGSGHFQTAVSRSVLGNVQCAQNRYEEALATFQQALRSLEQAIGRHNVYAAALHSNMAAVLMKLNKYDEARLHSEKALRIRTALGEQLCSPDIGNEPLEWGRPDVGYALTRIGMGPVSIEGPASALTPLTWAAAVCEPRCETSKPVQSRLSLPRAVWQRTGRVAAQRRDGCPSLAAAAVPEQWEAETWAAPHAGDDTFGE